MASTQPEMVVVDIGTEHHRSIMARIFNARQRTRMYVALLVGIVIGWCISGLVALGRNSKSDIQERCDGNLLWELLVAMIVVNIGCTFSLVHIWYYKHFHNIRVYAHTNVTIHFVIMIQIAMTAWGSSIIFSPCSIQHLSHFFVYSVVYAWMIWQLLIIITMVLIALCVCIVFSGAAL